MRRRGGKHRTPNIEHRTSNIERRTEWTPEVQGRIVAAVELGASPTRAGILAGISAQRVSEWRAKRPEFREAIEAAQRRGLEARLRAIHGGVKNGRFPL